MKTRNFLMVGILLLTLVLSVSAADIVVTPQTSTLAYGDTAALTVGVQNVENLGGFDIDLRWDPSVVEVATGDVHIGARLLGAREQTALRTPEGSLRVPAGD